jgi:hypothetical protein
MIRSRHFHVSVSLALTLLAAAAVAAAQAAKPAPAQTKPAPLDDAREANLRAYTELLRSDLRSQKAAIITDVMNFTEEEDAKFWPIYREYETELSKINDDRIALIKEYADAYENMTDAIADKLARGALDLEARRHAVKVKYYDRFKSALSAKTAARFLQVENQILLILDLQIASSLPITQ